MSTKFVMVDRVRRVEEKIARQWIRGSGPKAEFREGSEGWWAIFESCPASMYLGTTRPELKAGDAVRITLEKV
jgi:hypothetical protein